MGEVLYCKFKDREHPCIVYYLLSTGINDLYQGRYVEHWEISILGEVPAELLEETDFEDGDIHAIDLAIKLEHDPE